jgi:phytoene dehydrogenase-like protein
MPIPRGGGQKLADALVALIRENGGTCETDVHVERVFSGGVRTAGGETISGEAVICNVTPTQLYGDLVEGFEDKAKRFRYGRSDMQIHYALSEPPRWEGDDRLARTAIVHITPGLDGVSRAVNEAERGLLPAEATVVVGQPLTMDESRAPNGKGILWIQLQELPWRIKGDAAGEIDVGAGVWTENLRERYADRIQARLARQIPNLESSILDRTVLSPADLQAANVNLRHGDPYSGSLALDQNFLWRPLPSQPGHRTPVPGVWHIGASTHPGPGLGGGSGALVAQQLLAPSLVSRARRLVRR